eukprot:5734649-Prymnesium_polylepis.2
MFAPSSKLLALVSTSGVACGGTGQKVVRETVGAARNVVVAASEAGVDAGIVACRIIVRRARRRAAATAEAASPADAAATFTQA